QPTLRAVLTVLGAALGGVPVAFIAASEHRWLYPVGLLMGFLWVRAVSIWKTIAEPAHSPERPRRTSPTVIFELTFVFSLTCLAAIYVFITPQSRFSEQAGEIRTTGSGIYEVFYAQ